MRPEIDAAVEGDTLTYWKKCKKHTASCLYLVFGAVFSYIDIYFHDAYFGLLKIKSFVIIFSHFLNEMNWVITLHNKDKLFVV